MIQVGKTIAYRSVGTGYSSKSILSPVSWLQITTPRRHLNDAKHLRRCFCVRHALGTKWVGERASLCGNIEANVAPYIDNAVV